MVCDQTKNMKSTALCRPFQKINTKSSVNLVQGIRVAFLIPDEVFIKDYIYSNKKALKKFYPIFDI